MSDEREKIRQVNPDGFSWTQNRGVDVAAAEAAFSDLERRLSSASWSSNTGFSLHDPRADNVEDGNTSEDSTVGQRFNLEETLRGNQKVSFTLPINLLFFLSQLITKLIEVANLS